MAANPPLSSTLCGCLRILTASVGILVWISSSGFAQTRDTLSAYRALATNHTYNVPGLTLQAARFEPRASGRVDKVRVLLGGDSAHGSARVRFFGFEAGAAGPFLEIDKIAPVRIYRTKPGLQWVDVALPESFRFDQRQFFVAVDSLTLGTALISDKIERSASCLGAHRSWRDQYLKTETGQWHASTFGFAIDVVVVYDHEPTTVWLSDVTSRLGIRDTTRVEGGIAWGDIDQDARPDLLVNGRLYRNANDTTFVDVTEAAGLHGTPKVGFFLDADNDDDQDVLFLGVSDDNDQPRNLLFRNDRSGRFTVTELALPVIEEPTTFSIADINGDGQSDVFLGQGRTEQGDVLPSLLLVSSLGRTFRVDTVYVGDGEERVTVSGSQWLDVDDDGALELYLATSTGPRVIEFDGSGLDQNRRMAASLASTGDEGREPTAVLGGDWQMHASDRPATLLATHHADISLLSESSDRRSVRFERQPHGYGLVETYPDGVDVQELAGSASWVDIDSDGDFDAFLASGHPCQAARLLENRGDRSKMVEVSSAAGLFNLPGGPDGVWVDFNNDGRPDLSTLVNGRIHLLKNEIPNPGNWVTVDIPDDDFLGGTVTVYTDTEAYAQALPSGRGLMMQSARRLTIGLGNTRSIDSIVVVAPHGRRAVIAQAAINDIVKLAPESPSGGSTANAISEVTARPNPFSSTTDLSFTLLEKSSVSVAIFDLTGELVRSIDLGTLVPGQHSTSWDGRDNAGQSVSSGRYSFRVYSGEGGRAGTVVKTH